MRLGKLDNDKLNELILSRFSNARKEVVCSPRIGVDCAAVDIGGDDNIAVLSTDPITSANKNIGGLTVHVSCNDAAAAGAEPLGLLVTLLCPPSSTENEIADIADELCAAAKKANVDIIGGHTEVTDSVTRFVTSATVLAKVKRGRLVTPSGMKPDDDIIITKYAALEGTSLIASDFADKLDMLDDNELSLARDFINEISVVKEGIFAAEHGATAMHDVTEGGVLGAAWEMAEASGCGICIYEHSVPIHELTRRICSALSLEPLGLLSSGAMLIACKNGSEMVRGLEKEGVKAAIIGRALRDPLNRTLSDGTPILAPRADELYKLFES